MQVVKFLADFGDKVIPNRFLVEFANTGKTLCDISKKTMEVAPPYIKLLNSTFSTITDWTYALFFLIEIKYFFNLNGEDEYLMSDVKKIRNNKNKEVFARVISNTISCFCLSIPTSIQCLQKLQLIQSDLGFISTLARLVGDRPNYGMTAKTMGSKLTDVCLVIIYLSQAYLKYREVQKQNKEIEKSTGAVLTFHKSKRFHAQLGLGSSCISLFATCLRLNQSRYASHVVLPKNLITLYAIWFDPKDLETRS